jgi:F0F1-type ATP synthase assembly protein I
MAFQIGGAIILGIIVGWWLDKQLDCRSHAFTALFAILGIFVGLYSVIKDVLKK